ncbi:MAG: hypothetical protein QM650_15430 [Microlunatus sp.]
MRVEGPDEVRTPVGRAPIRAGPSPAAKAGRKGTGPPADAAPANRLLLGLQASAGNGAVNALLTGSAAGAPVETPAPMLQRLAGAPASIPPPPVPPGPPVPAEHPGFKATQAKLSAARRGLAAHPPAQTKVEEAARAAKPPADDKEAQAKTAKAGEMGAAPTPGFDKAAFIAAVTAAIAKQTPKNLDEADKFSSSGKSDAIAAEVKGKVGAGKDASAKPMADASEKPPDLGAAKDKPVTELPPTPAAGPPPAIGAGAAMPGKAPADQTNLGHGPASTDQQMAEAGVTEEQLAKSNEPEFTDALAAKKEGEAHSAAAPAAFRAGEAQQLAAAQQGAEGAGTQAIGAMVAGRATGLQQVAGGQQQARSADEQKRAEVSAKVKSIFDTTKTEVDGILNGLDGLVDTEFTAGEARAKSAFTADLDARMEKYKDERYSGPSGWAQWVADQFQPLPPEVQEICNKSKKLYETEMSKVISKIADIIGRELGRAKDRVAQGRREITTYVDGLDPALKSVGRQAAKDIGSQFDSLTSSIDEKSQSLVDDLAEKYVEARQGVDDAITKMQEENKGLWDKAKDAVGGAIETILKLKTMLLGVLARAAGAVENIIKDPIGFLGNFVNAVKTGVMNFGSNILQHLKKGLQSWLFGALAEAGIEIPASFDLKGIVGLILSLLGLTWASIRARLAKVLPDWVITAMEKTVEVVQILTSEGVGGLWKWIVAKISDLKEQVMSQVREFVITKVITAGITWLISLLNPAAAFIKACKMIYDAVMWFVDNAERLGDFVRSVLDSVESIAAGGVGKVAALIEATLGKAVPMVISGLASLLGLGGIADKIKKILQTIQKPVGKIVDGLIKGVVKYGKKLLGKKKGKEKEGGDGPDPRSDAEKKAAVHQAVIEGEKLAKAPKANYKLVQQGLGAIKSRFKLVALELVPNGLGWYHIHGKINPEDDGNEFPLLDLKEVDIQGKTIKCAVSGAAIVPVDKIVIYGTGKVNPPSESEAQELATLRAEKDAEYADRLSKGERLPKKINYRLQDSRKEARLAALDRLEHNFERSSGNLKSLTAVGLDASVGNLQTIISKVLDAGGKVDLLVENTTDTQIEAPRGPLIVTSKWRESSDGRKQLVTVMFKTPRGA